MRKILLIVLSLGVIGCISISSPKIGNLEEKVTQLQNDLLSREQEITRLQNLCDAKDEQLKGKDLKIEQLRKKLEGFGVF